MRFLSPFGLGLVVVPLGVFLPVKAGDLLLALGEGLLREVYRVGTHVGNETLLIEMLRDGHGLRNRHAQFAARLLLQGGGGERGCRKTLRGFFFGPEHREAGSDAGLQEVFGLLAGVEPVGELRFEKRLVRVGGGIELGYHAEIGRGAESDDFALALHQQPHGDALHAAGRELGFHLFPEYGRELESYEPVQHAAGLLRIDQIHIDGAGALDRIENGPLGDFVKDDPPGLIHRQSEHLGQVPGDGLSLAVLIGGEPDGLVFSQACELVHHLAFVGRYFVNGAETLGDVDAEVFFREVADMAETRFDDEIPAEEFLDGLGLGRGLHDN